jgi:hypothetical protein
MGAALIGSGLTAFLSKGSYAVGRSVPTSQPAPEHAEVEATPQVIERTVYVTEVSPPPSAKPTREKEVSEQAAAEPIDLAADMESLFQNDRNSGENTRRYESTLQSAFHNPQLKGVKVDRIDCKAETCRVAITFDSHEADVDAMKVLLGDPNGILSLGKSMSIPNRSTSSDGRVTATMYFHPSLPPLPKPGQSPPN